MHLIIGGPPHRKGKWSNVVFAKADIKVSQTKIMHYVKMVHKTGTEPDTNQTRIKQLPKPAELFSVIILNRERSIY